MIEGVIAQMTRLTVQLTLRQRIIESQREDPSLHQILSQLVESAMDGFSKSSNDGLLCQGCPCIPTMYELRKEILTETYNSSFSMHPDSIKIYQDLKQRYWWRSMKKDVTEFVSKCLVCHQVKASR